MENIVNDTSQTSSVSSIENTSTLETDPSVKKEPKIHEEVNVKEANPNDQGVSRDYKRSKDLQKESSKDRILIPSTSTLEKIIKKVIRDEIRESWQKNNYEEELVELSENILSIKELLCTKDKDGNSFNLVDLFHNLVQSARNQSVNVKNQEEIIKKQRFQIDNYAEDILYKTQRPLIEELISIRELIQEVRRGKNYKDISTLSNCIDNIDKKAAYTLRLVGVEEFNSGKKPIKTFDEKKQEVVPFTKIAYNKEDNDMFLPISSGYKWTMSASNDNTESARKDFIIKYEKVARLQYEEHPNKNNTENRQNFKKQ